nr:MAG TPA: hypothetical protein [Caudoviricetes sp.]
MITQDIEICTLNIIRESKTELSIFAEKKQMVKIGNIAITAINEFLFEVYDFRTGLKIATLTIHKEWQSVEFFMQFFRNFEMFTRDIIPVRDILLKQFIEIKLHNIPCGACMEFSMVEFEQFLLENQP